MLTLSNSSIPSKDEILVPETLLKKRKSQEKERESRAADLKKKREVRAQNNLLHPYYVVMIFTHTRLDYGQCCRQLTIFRG